MGFVNARTDDADEWRREIKAKVRADKLHVRTGVYRGGDDVAAVIRRL